MARSIGLTAYFVVSGCGLEQSEGQHSFELFVPSDATIDAIMTQGRSMAVSLIAKSGCWDAAHVTVTSMEVES